MTSEVLGVFLIGSGTGKFTFSALLAAVVVAIEFGGVDLTLDGQSMRN
jgi:hypothetical protein